MANLNFRMHNNMVFIPESVYSSNPEPQPETGEFLGSVNIGLAEMVGAHALAHAFHLIDLLEPVVQAQTPSLSRSQSYALQMIDNGSLSDTPQGAGSNPGIWISTGTAVALGIISEEYLTPNDVPDMQRAQQQFAQQDIALPMLSTSIVQNRILNQRERDKSQNTWNAPKTPAARAAEKRRRQGSSFSSPRIRAPWERGLAPRPY